MRIIHPSDLRWPPKPIEDQRPVPIPPPPTDKPAAIWPGHEKFLAWLMAELKPESVGHWKANTTPSGPYSLINLNCGPKQEDFAISLDAWLPALSESGLILHSATQSKRWAELKQNHKKRWFEFRHAGGLGIIAPKAGPLPPEIDALFALDYGGALEVRAKYDDSLKRRE